MKKPKSFSLGDEKYGVSQLPSVFNIFLDDRGYNASCNIKEFGLKALPTERGKVKPVDCPLVDDRPCVLKSNGRKKQEKRGGITISEAAKSLA